jgi:hypothetical protein
VRAEFDALHAQAEGNKHFKRIFKSKLRPMVDAMKVHLFRYFAYIYFYTLVPCCARRSFGFAGGGRGGVGG